MKATCSRIQLLLAVRSQQVQDAHEGDGENQNAKNEFRPEPKMSVWYFWPDARKGELELWLLLTWRFVMSTADDEHGEEDATTTVILEATLLDYTPALALKNPFTSKGSRAWSWRRQSGGGAATKRQGERRQAGIVQVRTPSVMMINDLTNHVIFPAAEEDASVVDTLGA